MQRHSAIAALAALRQNPNILGADDAEIIGDGRNGCFPSFWAFLPSSKRQAPDAGREIALVPSAPFALDRNPDALVWKHLEAAGRMAVSGQGRFREQGLPLAA